MADRRQRRTEQAIAAQLRGEQAVNAHELVLFLGRVIDIIIDEAPDTETAARVVAASETRVKRQKQANRAGPASYR